MWAWSYQYEEWLRDLTNLPAVSGDEGPVRRYVLRVLRHRVDHLEVDVLGNVYALRRARRVPRGQDPPRVLLAAHMDEVGFMLTGHDGHGFFRFEPVGGLSTRNLLGQRVVVGPDRVPGVIGAAPVHLQSRAAREAWPEFRDLRIQVSPAARVEPGMWATFATPFRRSGPSVMAKALDDRVGVATLLALWDVLPPHLDVWTVFTVQEEVGLRGATVAARKVRPHLALALDCTLANDVPAPDGRIPERYNARLGRGPALYVADRMTVSDPWLLEHFRRTAQQYGLPFQLRQGGGGATDAGAIHRQAGGIPSLSVSVPARYLHGPVSLMRLSDWAYTWQLVAAGLAHLPQRV